MNSLGQPTGRRDSRHNRVGVGNWPPERLPGTLSRVGTGTRFDPNNTVPMPAGTFVTHFGKQVHYDGAKDEETVLQITGEGPATSTPAEEK